MITFTIFMDGNRSETGYKYLVRKDCYSWKGFRTDSGFRYFMNHYGLKIDAQTVRITDNRAAGKGRVMYGNFCSREIKEMFFWKQEEIPEGAERFVGLCNGNYVNCYAKQETERTVIYRPNPNAENVYWPYDYRTIDKQIG